MTRTAVPERSNFFVRSNYELGACPREADEVAVRQEQSLKAATDGLARIEQAITWIRQGTDVEAALWEIGVALLAIKALIARDPGIRMAADDLYQAAAAVVSAKRAGPTVVDMRRWRLLNEADWRLRARVGSPASGSPNPVRAHPGERMPGTQFVAGGGSRS
jgi:hypothetical protein